MHGMSAELTLKCFLELKGVNPQVLKKPDTRHNLSKLTALAMNNQMPLSAYVAECLLRMNPSHNSHFFRYGTGEHDQSKVAFKIPLCDSIATHIATAIIQYHATNDNQNTRMLEIMPQFNAEIIKAKSSPNVTLQQFNELKTRVETEQTRIQALSKGTSFFSP
jgi:hypothetical protein